MSQNTPAAGQKPTGEDHQELEIYLHVSLWSDLLCNICLENTPAAGQKPTGEDHQELGAVLHTAHNVLNHWHANLKKFNLHYGNWNLMRDSDV
jgi:hypothetical protein